MKPSKQKIVFIGSGKVATSLSHSLKGKRDIVQIYSKTLYHARKLAKEIGCFSTNSLHEINDEADIYIIAVKDDAIEEVCKKLNLQGKIVIHTSGSTSIDVLKNASDKCGVLWAMFSFAGNVKVPSDSDFFIEATDKITEKEIKYLVKDLKGKPIYMDSERRAMAHLIAVFVNNFPNHLFAIAEFLCKEAAIPFELFLPLAFETAERILKQSPAKNQTGPASRNDKRIISKQVALLKGYPIYKDIYELLTKSIIQSQPISDV